VKRLFITPHEVPQSTLLRCLDIPAAQDWLGVINAALLLMIDPNNYEQLHETDLTPDAAAARAYQIYVQYLLGDCGMFNCDDLLACADTLNDILSTDGGINPNFVQVDTPGVLNERFPPVDRENEVAPPPANCDYDLLWAGCKEIATRIDGYGLDWLERIVQEVDNIERMAIAANAIPILSSLAAPALYLLVDEAENIRNRYTAYSSASVIEAIACDLFAMGCNECRYPTYNELMNYYAGLGIASFADYGAAALGFAVDCLIGTSGTSNLITYYTVNLFQLYVRGLGASFLGQSNMSFVSLWAQLGEDVPSNDWELLCPCPAQAWEAHYLGENGWDASKFNLPPEMHAGCNAYYDDVNKWLAGCCPGPGTGMYMVAYGQTARYTRVHLRIDVYKTRAGEDLAMRVKIGDTVIDSALKTTLSAQSYFVDWTGDLTGILKIESTVRTNNCDVGYARVLYLNLYGLGGNPY